MDKNKLIANQQLEIENLKEMLSGNKEIKDRLVCLFYSIGSPLNDNCLEFNSSQLRWLKSVVDMVEGINTLKYEEDEE
jgi:hypothetical protein